MFPNIKALKRKFCYPNIKFGASLLGHSLFGTSLLRCLLKFEEPKCKLKEANLHAS